MEMNHAYRHANLNSIFIILTVVAAYALAIIKSWNGHHEAVDALLFSAVWWLCFAQAFSPLEFHDFLFELSTGEINTSTELGMCVGTVQQHSVEAGFEDAGMTCIFFFCYFMITCNCYFTRLM